jgi:triacylglycerol lipase
MILTPHMLLALAMLAGADYATLPDGIVIDAGGDVRAVLTEMDGYLVISVRGTVIADLDNWLTDFDALPAYHAAIGWAPRGFLDAALALLARVGPYIEDTRLILTGHSLGGAVAVLLAALLVRAGRAVAAYAAFEPARSGFGSEAHALEGIPGYITCYGNDPVPEVPPIYRHPCAVTAIGHDALDPFTCHSIAGVIVWLRAAVA